MDLGGTLPTLTAVSSELVGVCDTTCGVRYHYEMRAIEVGDGTIVIAPDPCTSVRKVKQAIVFGSEPAHLDNLAAELNGKHMVKIAKVEGNLVMVELDGYSFDSFRRCLNIHLRDLAGELARSLQRRRT